MYKWLLFFLFLSVLQPVGRCPARIVFIYVRQHFTEFFLFFFSLFSLFLFFFFTLTQFMYIHSLVRQLKRKRTRPSTNETVRRYYFSLVLTLTLSPILLSVQYFFSFFSSSHLTFSPHPILLYPHTFKVIALYSVYTVQVVTYSL